MSETFADVTKTGPRSRGLHRVLFLLCAAPAAILLAPSLWSHSSRLEEILFLPQKVVRALEAGNESHGQPWHSHGVTSGAISGVEVRTGKRSNIGRSGTDRSRNKSRQLAVPTLPLVADEAAAAAVPVPPRCFTTKGVEYCLPSIVGVCCIRSGSTALAEHLNSHPFLSYGTTKEHHAFRFLPTNSPMFRATNAQLPSAAAGGGSARAVAKRPGETPARTQARLQYALSAAAGPPSADLMIHHYPPGKSWLRGDSGAAGAAADEASSRSSRSRSGSSSGSSGSSSGGSSMSSIGQLAYVHGPGQWNWTRADFTTISRHPSGGNMKMGQMQGPIDETAYTMQFPSTGRRRKPITNSPTSAPSSSSSLSSSLASISLSAITSSVTATSVRPLRFDFDPAYMGGTGSGAAAGAIFDLLASDTKLLMVLRNPFHQACSKLTGKLPSNPPPSLLQPLQDCWTAAGSAPNLAVPIHKQARPVPSETMIDDHHDIDWRAPFRVHFDDLRERKTCFDPWLAHLHSFCYVEHLELWLEQGFKLKQFFVAKTEELKDVRTRREVVFAAVNFTGAHAQSQAALSSSSSSSSSSSEDSSALREALRAFEASLAKEHNVHRDRPPTGPLSSGSAGTGGGGGGGGGTGGGSEGAANSEGKAPIQGAPKVAAAARAEGQTPSDDPFMAQCEAALRTPQSYLHTCNARLAALLGDEKWRWSEG